jgi:hypothetical protein
MPELGLSSGQLFSPQGGFTMTANRKVIDCRNFPSENNCTLAISGTEEEVLDLAVLHATTVHGHENKPELREQIRSLLADESESSAATA